MDGDQVMGGKKAKAIVAMAATPATHRLSGLRCKAVNVFILSLLNKQL
jgi:hypothetical protein